MNYWLSRALFLTAFVCGSFIAAFAQQSYSSLETLDGKRYSNVTVQAVESSGIKISHAAGVARVNFLHLPEALRAAYKFDPKDAQDSLDANALIAKQQQEKLDAIKKTDQRTVAANVQQQQQLLKDVKTDQLNKMVDNVLTVKKDRFTGSTTISFRHDLKLNEDVEVSGWVLCTSSNDAFFHLRFTRIADSWRWLSYHKAYWLVDGVSRYEDSDLTTNVLSGGRVYEAFSFSMNRDQAKEFVKSKSAAVKIGIDEFDLTDEHRSVIAALLYKHQLLFPQKSP